MKFWVSLDGRETEVEFRAADGRLWLERDGETVEADFCRLPDGEVYSLLIGGRSYEVRVSAQGEGLEVSVGGRSLAVDVRHPLERLLQSAERAHGGGTAETVAAPMPGVVVEMRVKPGESVAAGQPVAIVEAMKMQNELVARHGGIVSDVLVRAGDTVSAGQALARLRPASP